MVSRKTVVIATSAQPSANPRAVREAISLQQAGYVVYFLYCPISLWADAMDAQLFQDHPAIHWICVGKRLPAGRYKAVRVRRKLFELVYSFLKTPAVALFSNSLYAQELKKFCLTIPADHYRGHNLGALPAIVAAAKKYKAQYSFDAEDFHRGESNDKEQAAKIKIIEDHYYRSAKSLSVASPLALQQYRLLYPQLNVILLNNVFSKKYISNIQEPVRASLKLFWFSQTIGPNRGLELLGSALHGFTDADFSVYILGNISEQYKSTLKSVFPETLQPHILQPIAQTELFNLAATMHIGLASEPGFSENNEIALSNKLFTYLSSGLMILASNTKGQADFIDCYPGVGLLYNKASAKSLHQTLKELLQNPLLVSKFGNAAKKLALEELNWEQNEKTLLQIVEDIKTVH